MPVSRQGALLQQMCVESSERPALLGFDFPIGIPAEYATIIGCQADFPRWLCAAATNLDQKGFFTACHTIAQVGPSRPFYPHWRAATGDKARALGRIGLSSKGGYRCCDLKAGAESMFWTLGPRQVGKGALSGWREILVPALANQEETAVSVWPFDGDLSDLLDHHRVVIAETYPAELYHRVGIARYPQWSKRRRSDRVKHAPAIFACATRLSIQLDTQSQHEIRNGFGASSNGEDRFDALVGLLGMIDVLEATSARPVANPNMIAVEGWMLGL